MCVCASGSPAAISNHSYKLARLVYTRLSSWRHSNGQCLTELYHGNGDSFMSSKTQGPIVNFNLLRADGSYVGFTQVTTLIFKNLLLFSTYALCEWIGVASVTSVHLCDYILHSQHTRGLLGAWHSCFC